MSPMRLILLPLSALLLTACGKTKRNNAIDFKISSGGNGSGTLVASGSVFNGGAFGNSTVDSSIQLPHAISRTA